MNLSFYLNYSTKIFRFITLRNKGIFDFYLRNYIGSQVHFNEYTRGTRPINAKNIKERSETILDQYGKTGSLYPHNVVLVPLGDDFMYYEVI